IVDGHVLARHSAAYARADRADLWLALRRHALGHCLSGAPDRQLHRRMVRRVHLPGHRKLYTGVVGRYCAGGRGRGTVSAGKGTGARQTGFSMSLCAGPPKSRNTSMHSSRSDPLMPSRRGRVARAAGLVALALVMGLAFLGYASPEMKLQWENLMALCGF